MQMQKDFGTKKEASSRELPLSVSQYHDAELQGILERKTLTRATHGRILKLKNLVRAITNCKELRVDKLAEAVGYSESLVKKYVRQLQSVDVIEIARHEPFAGVVGGKPVYRLGPNRERAEAILSWDVSEPEPKVRELRPVAMCEHRPGKVHILIGDMPRHSPPSVIKNVRDPLIAALFGDATKR